MPIRPLHALILILALVSTTAYAQLSAPVTQISTTPSTVTVAVDTDIVVFRACSDRAVMVNYRPGGIKDPDTLVVGPTTWPDVSASIDTSGDPIGIQTAGYRLEIDRAPFRIHFRRSDGSLLCEEPAGGGIMQNLVTLATTGGRFYGVHNRSQGLLSTGTGGPILAGNQGQAGGPFAWTTAGWGFLADADGGNITIGASSLVFDRPSSAWKRDLEFFLIAGSPRQILRGLCEATGMPPLPPRWALGFMNTEWGIDQPELFSDIATYRSKSIPIDGYILDFDWMDWGADNYGEFRWGPKFPGGPTGVIADSLSRWGMHLMGIRKPRVHVATTQGAYAQGHNFFLGYSTDYFSKQQVGLLNFHDPAVREWYWSSFAVRSNSYGTGITGYWNDEADEYGGSLMFMQMQRAQYEGQRALNDQRVWSINRNFYTGAQRYAYGLWSGDIGTGFSSMANQRLFMLSSVVLGAAWWSMDVGGFHGTPTPENYYRWIQFGAFVPVFRVHGTYNEEREPWYYGAEAESLATAAIRLRYRLLPYIYSAAWDNHLTGLPIARPLVMDYPDDPAVAEMTSEWMFGPDLIVSPVVTSGATSQSIYLPAGTWYEYRSGRRFVGPTSFALPVTPSDMPIFVRAGAILPLAPPMRSTADTNRLAELILASYPDGSGSTTVRLDDGLTYAYERGASGQIAVTQTRTDRQATIVVGATTGMYREEYLRTVAEFEWIPAIPDSVVLDGVRVFRQEQAPAGESPSPFWMADTVSRTCRVQWLFDNSAHTVSVYFPAVPAGISRDRSDIPRGYRLYPNYPNPFNPSTRIAFDVPERSRVRLWVTDLLGRTVDDLLEGIVEAGSRSVEWRPDTSTGTYFCQFQARSETTPGRVFRGIRKMVLVR